MDRTTRLIFIFLGCVATFFGLLLLAFERIPVRTYGVKQYVWAGGIQPHDYTAGFCFGVTGIHVFHVLDASTHFRRLLEMAEKADDPARVAVAKDHLEALRVRTPS